MAKKEKRMCKECVLCVTGPYGLTRCSYGANGRKGDMIFPENRACKMLTGPVHGPRAAQAGRKEPQAGHVPQPGSAPFCGDFPKCNNAEGCDTCEHREEICQ